MAAGRGGRGSLPEDASGADLYAVLGLSRECTDAELRGAYRRLAMIWHPDRCSASGSSAARVEEAKERFQEIQGAYSVLSDSNKRFLYDVGVYDSEDDEADLSGMGDFPGEMADMMSQATPTETFEELQQLFVDTFQDDLDPGLFGGLPPGRRGHSRSPPSTSLPSSRPPPGRSNARAPPARHGGADKRGGSPATHSAAKRPRPGRGGLEPDLGLSGFCFLVSETTQAPWTTCEVRGGGDRRGGRKQRLSTSRDVAGDGMPRSFRPSQGGGAALWQ
ncbi:chaperone protein DnaJ-like [Panicum miliaceum]|uniref:Chaperone protein DnaJ-like n=1 Tax=Panicum miliaceum TaxID=4540 RepID=A0A3L6RYM3_PANMI|nr:chaperone protein DnaJ-like [Panicum miliaceum]